MPKLTNQKDLSSDKVSLQAWSVMGNLTVPLLAALDAVRSTLAKANIPHMNLRIEVTGRCDGDLNVQFKLCEQYDDDTRGEQLAPVVNEYLRRRGWNQRHAPLCLPSVATELKDDEIPF